MAPNPPRVPTTPVEGQAELVIRPHASLHLSLDVQSSTQRGLDTRQSSLCGSSSTPCAATQAWVSPAHVPDWSNLKIIHRNTLPPRSHFYLYDSEQEALVNDATKARSLLLSGLWGLNVTNGPFKGPIDFYNPDFDNFKWPLVKVPGMWSVTCTYETLI